MPDDEFSNNEDKRWLAIFGEALRDLRQKAGVTQEKLAERTRLDRSYISDIERGAANATLLVMLKLATALNTKLWTIIKQLEETAMPVLVVDDNAEIREVFRRYLAKMGLRADTAATGKEAVSKFAEGRYKLIFMDIQLPELGGLQATAAIRKLEETRKQDPAKIVGITAGYAGKSECLEAGMDDYTVKPVMFDQVRKLLGKYLNY